MTDWSVIYSWPHLVSNPMSGVVQDWGGRVFFSAWTMPVVSVDHYENFPVASVLCPPALRPSVAAIYGFARTADDLADEGDATPEERLRDLAEYRSDLHEACHGTLPSKRWPRVFDPLRKTILEKSLPQALLADLLSAFEQDVVRNTYVDRTDLLDYCRRSANPVGRLLLHLYGVDGQTALRRSDAICTALQLANFWQDLSVDTRRGRIYIPASDCTRHGVRPQALLTQADAPNVRALVSDMVIWAREMMMSGAPLVHSIPGRAGWELRFVVQGGLRVLEKIESMSFATPLARPTLHFYDAPLLFWRALTMRPADPVAASNSA